MPTRNIYVLMTLLAATACASGVPRAIEERPANAPSLAEARAAGADSTGRLVRWGGTIAAVDNRASESRVEIVERPLLRGGRPQTGDTSGGRFLARVDRFLDPALYAAGREVTVAGTIEGFLSRPIGEYPYTYAIVKVEAIYLWPQIPERSVYDHYWQDPWYGPWYHRWHHPLRYPYPR